MAKLGVPITFPATTHDADGAADADALPTWEVRHKTTGVVLASGTMVQDVDAALDPIIGRYHATFTPTTAAGFVAGAMYDIYATATVGGITDQVVALAFLATTYSIDDLPPAVANALSAGIVHVHSMMAPGGRAVLLEKATYSSATGQRLPFPLRSTDPDAAGADTCVMHILSNTDDSILVTLTGPITGAVGSQTGYISVTTAIDLDDLTKGEDYRYRTYAKYGSDLSLIAMNTIQRKD